MRKATRKEGILVFLDWEFPSFARNLGWNGKVRRGDRCEHWQTDGTVKCPDCGADPSTFIRKAVEWLDRRCGDVLRAPMEEYFLYVLQDEEE